MLKKPYGAAADQWSLGCILYTFLVGRPPFESAEIKNTFEKVSKVEYYIPPWLSEEAKDLVSKLIIHNPDDRLSAKMILEHPFMRVGIPRPQVHLTEPIYTRWLKPLRQSTKHGVFELLSDGHIWVDFMVDPTITVISPDGMNVKCYEKGTQQSHLSVIQPVETQTWPDLIPAKAKIYEYARRFVGLMRSKTPRLIISTAKFKAFLMCNGPPADFMIKTNDLVWTLEFGATAECLKIFKYSTLSVSILRPSALDLNNPQLTSESRLLVSEFLGRYQQAMTTLKRIKEDQDRGTFPFPFVVREHSSTESGNTAFYQPTIPQMTLSDTLVKSKPLAQPNSFETAAKSFVIAYKTFMSGVGWCLASSSDQYLMLFSDGVSVLVDGRENLIGLWDGQHKPRWYRIDATLPDLAKRRLVHFPKFVQLLKQGYSQSLLT